MLILDQSTPHWRLLTPNNVTLRRAFPWGRSIQKILWHEQPRPFHRRDLLITSDYGGEHNGPTHLVYAFLITDAVSSTWPAEIRKVRASSLTKGRRMSFKRLDDVKRQNALVPFLQAADTLDGHLAVIAVDKRIKWLMTRKGEVVQWQRSLQLNAKWNDRSFEDMARKAYIFSLLLSLWSRPQMNICWISDQDQSVANEDRLDDAQKFAARMSTLLVPHSMGEFAMNSTAIDDPKRVFEDFCALPDLAAGMVAEVCATLGRRPADYQIGQDDVPDQNLSPKAQLIADWFWYSKTQLRKTMIRIDVLGNQYCAQKVDMMSLCDDCLEERQERRES